MAFVYRKTPKGLVEIETRAHRLAPRLRGALILVDGRKSDDELATVDPRRARRPCWPACSPMATSRLRQRWPIATPRASRRPSHPPRHRPCATSGPRSRAPAATPCGNSTISSARMPRAVAIKMERAKTMPELQPLLAQAVALLRAVRSARRRRGLCGAFHRRSRRIARAGAPASAGRRCRTLGRRLQRRPHRSSGRYRCRHPAGYAGAPAGIAASARTRPRHSARCRTGARPGAA